MSSIITCPHCQRSLRMPDWAAGKAVRCPACQGVIPAVTAPSDEPRLPSRALTDEPSPRTASAGSRPRFSRVEDEYEDREPRPRRRKSRRKGSSSCLTIGLIVGGIGLGLLVVCGGIGTAVYFAFNKSIPESEWTTFNPPNANCTMLMPGTPSPKPLMVNGMMVDKYVLERKRESAVFAFVFLNLDADPLPPNMLDTLTTAERDNLVRAVNGRVTSEKQISLGSFPGREVHISAGRGVLVTRFYLVKINGRNRLYMLMAGGDYMRAGSPDISRFFDSFKLDTNPVRPVGGLRR